ncbi:sensor histidine kinase [Psychrobacter aestuarii]|nr:ATP-binding protein [Psychrobacter aestuarii]
MNDAPKSPRFAVPLFWRLFLSLLVTIALTAVLSILVERHLNEQALAAGMDRQIERLMIRRAPLIAALEAGNLDSVAQMYRRERRIMNQIRVYDDEGSIWYPRYREPTEPRERSSDTLPPASEPRAPRGRSENPRERPLSVLDRLLHPTPPHKALANLEARPELAEVPVRLPDGQRVIVQLRPHLLFKDVLALQHTNLAVRVSLIMLFSVLMCFWLSRTMTRRIRQVQHRVHRMIAGDYHTPPSQSPAADDELGRLARDVSELSKRLADSELARKQVLSDISHELRSPLARLEVATELARDCAPEAQRYLARIDKETARMNELIEHIIRIQALQMQKYTLEDSAYETVVIPDLIDEIGQDVCFEFQQKGVQWHWQMPDNTAAWCVKGNPEQLRSAIENIIRNAFMHTPLQGRVIAQLDQPMRGQLRIRISDEGGGVDAADTERIFQPFVRLDSARHRQTGGYGLGLAIAQAIISAHKGEVSAENHYSRTEAGAVQGLMVQIYLPQ